MKCKDCGYSDNYLNCTLASCPFEKPPPLVCRNKNCKHLLIDNGVDKSIKYCPNQECFNYKKVENKEKDKTWGGFS